MLARQPKKSICVILFQKGLEVNDRFATEKMGVIEYEASLVMTLGHNLASSSPAFQDRFHVLFIL